MFQDSVLHMLEVLFGLEESHFQMIKECVAMQKGRCHSKSLHFIGKEKRRIEKRNKINRQATSVRHSHTHLKKEKKSTCNKKKAAHYLTSEAEK